MTGKVIMTAERHNWGLHTIDDWQQTKYILFEDGTLQEVVFEGRAIRAKERTLKADELAFIKNNAKEYAFNAPEVMACDGEAWKFEGPDFCFDLGYIYDSDLEKIARMLVGRE